LGDVDRRSLDFRTERGTRRQREPNENASKSRAPACRAKAKAGHF
jgi:hypothetical protein